MEDSVDLIHVLADKCNSLMVHVEFAKTTQDFQVMEEHAFQHVKQMKEF